jgi:cytochrome c-type biogenesis protein CcmH/NrfG
MAHAAADRCRAPHASVDACDDAIRWNPRDPTLLVAMGDAQLRARRFADAARAYRRAAALAPGTAGIQQKISAADALAARAKSAAERNAAAGSGAKRYTNEDPETQSH